MTEKSDRLNEFEAFVSTKAGIKGLVDSNITEVPRIFHVPSSTLSNHKPSHNLTVPIINLGEIKNNDGDTSSRNIVVSKIKDAAENWGFFQVINHGIRAWLFLGMMGKTRIEELCYELYGSSKQHDSWQRYAMVRELRELMKRPKASGSDHFERALNDEELIEPEVATDPIETKHELVSQVADSVSDVLLVQVVDSVSDVLLVPKEDSHVMDVEELSQKSTSGYGENVAHQLFDQMPLRIASKEKRRKSLKAWKFKFKTTSKRSKSMDVKFFSVEGIAWFTKDSKEINWGCVNKEFKEAVAGYGKTRVDQFKLVHATPRPGVNDRPLQTRVWDSGGSLLECVDEKSLGNDRFREVIAMVKLTQKPWDNQVWEPGGVLIEHDKWKWLETCYNHGRLMRFRHWVSSMCWKEAQDWIVSIWSKIQVFSDFDSASFIGLEICGFETTKHVLLLMKLANRVWECGALLATHVYHKGLEICYKHKWRFRLLESFSRPVVSAWINLLVSKAYEFSRQLQDSSKGEAEIFPLLNFSAGQHPLWMQDNSEPIFIVLELEGKKKLCPKSWMFKFKTDSMLKDLAFVKFFVQKIGVASEMENQTVTAVVVYDKRSDRVWEPGGLPTKLNMWDGTEQHLRQGDVFEFEADLLGGRMFKRCHKRQQVRKLKLSPKPWLFKFKQKLIRLKIRDKESQIAIDKEHSTSSLRANQIWDPGGKISLHLKLHVNSQVSESILQRKTEVCRKYVFM